MTRNYSDNKGRNSKSPPFVALPNEMLDSPAFLALSPHATRLLVAFGRQFRGMNNASLIMPFSIARKYGFTNERTYYKALGELKRRGFIEMTKPAIRRGAPCAARYALTWHPIHEPVGDVHHDAIPTVRPSNDWQKCTTELPATVPAKSRKATGRSASYAPAKLPVKKPGNPKPTGKTASQKPVFRDFRQADQPVDLISTRGGGESVEKTARPARQLLTVVVGGVS